MTYETNEDLLADMVGKTFTTIERGNDEMRLLLPDGSGYRFYHAQDCCESVWIEDVIGDLSDLLGSPLLLAEEVDNSGLPEVIREYEPESFTWTFYKFATLRGYVTVRWFGESNGYYSESVDICRVTPTTPTHAQPHP